MPRAKKETHLFFEQGDDEIQIRSWDKNLNAAAMTQAGIPSGSFCAMYPGPPKYYHTRDDRVDILEPKTVEKCLEIALQTVFLFDEQGLKTAYAIDE